MRLDVVPRVFEGGVGELLGLALDLLHRQDVDALTHREIDDAVDASADGVDVPGGQTHGISLDRPSDADSRDRRPQRGVGYGPPMTESTARWGRTRLITMPHPSASRSPHLSSMGRGFEVISAIADLTRTAPGVSVTAVAEHLGRDRSQVSRTLAALDRRG